MRIASTALVILLLIGMAGCSMVRESPSHSAPTSTEKSTDEEVSYSKGTGTVTENPADRAPFSLDFRMPILGLETSSKGLFVLIGDREQRALIALDRNGIVLWNRQVPEVLVKGVSRSGARLVLVGEHYLGLTIRDGETGDLVASMADNNILAGISDDGTLIIPEPFESLSLQVYDSFGKGLWAKTDPSGNPHAALAVETGQVLFWGSGVVEMLHPDGTKSWDWQPEEAWSVHSAGVTRDGRYVVVATAQDTHRLSDNPPLILHLFSGTGEVLGQRHTPVQWFKLTDEGKVLIETLSDISVAEVTGDNTVPLDLPGQCMPRDVSVTEANGWVLISCQDGQQYSAVLRDFTNRQLWNQNWALSGPNKPQVEMDPHFKELWVGFGTRLKRVPITLEPIETSWES